MPTKKPTLKMPSPDEAEALYLLAQMSRHPSAHADDHWEVLTQTLDQAVGLPDGYFVPFPFTARRLHNGVRVMLTVDWNGDRERPRLVCSGVHFFQVSDDTPVTAQSVRIPLESFLREAIRANTWREGELLEKRGGAPSNDVIDPAFTRRGRRGRPPILGDEELPNVAKVYQKGGVDAVRDKFHVGRTVAYQVIARARTAGHIAPPRKAAAKKSTAKKKGGKR